MIYVKSFELEDEFRGIKPFKMEFEDMNFIIGENGAGKSTYLHILRNKKFREMHGIKYDYQMHDIKEDVGTMFFDSEKHNPRTTDLQMSGNMEYGLHSAFLSHGESLMPILDHVKDMENCVIFLDEPESGISISNQKKLMSAFRKAVKNGCQLIISTHSYVFIKKSKRLFDIKSGSWIDSKEYLKNLKI